MSIDSDSMADVEFELKYTSADAVHADRFFLPVNLWRDILPEALAEKLTGARPGDRLSVSVEPGRDFPAYLPGKKQMVMRNQFNEYVDTPRYGRFYPQGRLKGLMNIFSDNIVPFRCLGVNAENLLADLNHPFSTFTADLTATVHNCRVKPFDRGGECRMVMECISDGPGMQVRAGGPTDFFDKHSFSRSDDENDGRFYEKPRRVTHVDRRAIQTITALYGGLLKPGMDVLDLMSSWRSHVPDGLGLHCLTGLGMNSMELGDNPQLDRHLVKDINSDPRLPFDNSSFDAVLCTVSVEYMTRPFAVFAEAARVLKPGGVFVLTFSNRWFPPKVIHLWTQLHEFERMGLVLDYFLRSAKFINLSTFSSRGWPRPEDDKYYPQMRFSDPVYAVWGERRPE